MLGVSPALDVRALGLALGLDLRDNLLDHLGLLLRLDLLQNLKTNERHRTLKQPIHSTAA